MNLFVLTAILNLKNLTTRVILLILNGGAARNKKKVGKQREDVEVGKQREDEDEVAVGDIRLFCHFLKNKKTPDKSCFQYVVTHVIHLSQTGGTCLLPKKITTITDPSLLGTA